MGGVGSGRPHPNALERATAMRDAYLSGRTLDAIGGEYGISRERVRQIIKKHFGCLSHLGGISVQGRARKAAIVAAKEARCQKVWGCTRRQYLTVRRAFGYLPFVRFQGQRNNARKRLISWEITFWEWWTIWQASGKWSRRGRTSGCFVMCRDGDTGPYKVGNVRIASAFQNIYEANNKSGLPVGVHAAKSGRFYALQRKRRLGTFDTPEEAHLAYLKSLSLQEAA
jgi:hypothetical protein